MFSHHGSQACLPFTPPSHIQLYILHMVDEFEPCVKTHRPAIQLHLVRARRTWQAPPFVDASFDSSCQQVCCNGILIVIAGWGGVTLKCIKHRNKKKMYTYTLPVHTASQIKPMLLQFIHGHLCQQQLLHSLWRGFCHCKSGPMQPM